MERLASKFLPKGRTDQIAEPCFGEFLSLDALQELEGIADPPPGVAADSRFDLLEGDHIRRLFLIFEKAGIEALEGLEEGDLHIQTGTSRNPHFDRSAARDLLLDF
jgi:hypothetical protein